MVVNEIDRITRQFVQRCLVSIFIVFSIISLFYLSKGVYLLALITGVNAIFHSVIMFIPFLIDVKSLRSLYTLYVTYITAALCPEAILLWNIGHLTVFFWYIIIPFGLAVIYPNRKIIYWCIYILFLICSMLLFSSYVEPYFSVEVAEEDLMTVNINTIFASFYFIAFFLYYSTKLNALKAKLPKKQIIEATPEEPKSNKVFVTSPSIEAIDSEYSIEKNNELFSRIIAYFELEEPYKDVGFNISQVASKLNTNASYISKAIKVNKNMNFTVFVNTYRVNKIKEMIKEDYHNRFTMSFIYSSAGFKHQSTFNKVFKQIEGITPSEYIQKQK